VNTKLIRPVEGCITYLHYSIFWYWTQTRYSSTRSKMYIKRSAREDTR